ncbi:MAG: methyltransferase [Planctomycetaceae bacterium]|nr:methyltransferase [Planctomycetaceae bacterium]
MPVRIDPPDRTSLVEMAQGYFRGKVLCAAVRLGVADALGNGAKSLDELASATASNPDSLSRFLRALASIGVVEELSPGRFVLTPFGRPLCRDAPDTVWASMVFWADLLADSWNYLADCVRAGGNSGATVAMEREGVKSRWSRNPDAKAIFHAVFAETKADDMAPYVAAHEFSRYQVVADLGGAGGGLLAAILKANPHIRGILVDRKEAVAGALPKLKAAGLADRCELLDGDLLESVPLGADAYLMKHVLHGYDDDRALRILQNCRAAMSANGRLLVIEAVLPEWINHSDRALERVLMSDLNMLAVTGGRERSQTEWASLLSSARFELRRLICIPDSTCRIIEAVPCD